MHKHTVKEMFDQTIISIEGAYAPSTIRAYKANFERFIQFCESLNVSSFPRNHM